MKSIHQTKSKANVCTGQAISVKTGKPIEKGAGDSLGASENTAVTYHTGHHTGQGASASYDNHMSNTSRITDSVRTYFQIHATRDYNSDGISSY